MKVSQMRRDAIYALRDSRYSFRPNGDQVLETRALLPLDLERHAVVRRDFSDSPGYVAIERQPFLPQFVGFVGEFETLMAHAAELGELSLDHFVKPHPTRSTESVPEGITMRAFQVGRVTSLWEDWAPVGEEIEAERERVAAADVARLNRDAELRHAIRAIADGLGIEDNGRSGVAINVERDEVRLNVGTLALLLGLSPEPITDDERRRAGEVVPERPSLKGAIRGRGHGNAPRETLPNQGLAHNRADR